MKCQILFSGKSKNKIIYLSSARYAHRMVKVKAKGTGDIWCVFCIKRDTTFVI